MCQSASKKRKKGRGEKKRVEQRVGMYHRKGGQEGAAVCVDLKLRKDSFVRGLQVREQASDEVKI
jgi:hypothetical protein